MFGVDSSTRGQLVLLEMQNMKIVLVLIVWVMINKK